MAWFTTSGIRMVSQGKNKKTFTHGALLLLDKGLACDTYRPLPGRLRRIDEPGADLVSGR
jgi:hypothetical protein